MYVGNFSACGCSRNIFQPECLTECEDEFVDREYGQLQQTPQGSLHSEVPITTFWHLLPPMRNPRDTSKRIGEVMREESSIRLSGMSSTTFVLGQRGKTSIQIDHQTAHRSILGQTQHEPKLG